MFLNNMHLLRAKLKEKKAYTLLEMITVIAVIAIVGTIMSAAIYGYMVSSYMIKADQTAKTLYSSAQNYLTRQKNLGNLEEFNRRVNESDDTIPAFRTEELRDILEENGYLTDSEEKEDWMKNHKSSSFAAIAINSSVNREPMLNQEASTYNPFYAEIVEPLLKDENTSEHTFLLEYDQTTGVVIGVFYTEKADMSASSYSMAEDDKLLKDNVIRRNAEDLRSKRQGYYGVHMSNAASNSIVLSEVETQLVNNDRLYLTWKDAGIASVSDGSAALGLDISDKLSYDITIKTNSRGSDGLVVGELKGIRKTAKETWKEAENGDSSAPLLIYKDGTYSLSLDCVHFDILDFFTKMQSTDMLYCEIQAKLDGEGVTGGKGRSNTQSACFGGGADKVTDLAGKEIDLGGNGIMDENGTKEKAFSLKYARHLNHAREVKANSCFVQTGSMDWKYPEKNNDSDHSPIKNDAYFAPLVFVEEVKSDARMGDYTAASYSGAYKVEKSDEGNYHQIRNLKIKVSDPVTGSNVGMFCINSGKIEGIQLRSTSVAGLTNVGAIAGKNAAIGSITDCAVQAAVSTAVSQETIPDLGKNIGGIIGVNEGTAKNLQTLSAAASENGKPDTQNRVRGTRNVGGVIGLNKAKKNVSELVNYNNIGIMQAAAGTLENFGGIVGLNESPIENCVNKGIIGITDWSLSKSNQPAYIGGLAGRNSSKITSCSSQIDEEKLGKSAAVLQACLESLNKADGKMPAYAGVCVGGLVGYNDPSGHLSKSSMNNVILGNRIVGGLIGADFGTYQQLTGSTAAADAHGVVAASGSIVGGLFGYTITTNIEHMTNRADVLGNAFVGGIVGINGIAYSNIEELLQEDWDTELDRLGEKKDVLYAELQTHNVKDSRREEIKTELLQYYHSLYQGVPLSDKIQYNAKILENKNYGFVYARKRYSGGIAGINLGTIQSSISNYDKGEDSLIHPNYEYLDTADCAGGITGLNKGKVSGTNHTQNHNIVYGSTFVGGVIGWNDSEVEGYRYVSGSVRGDDYFIGGFIGMNSNASSIVNVEVDYSGENQSVISGKDYVGGVIGGNVITPPGTSDQVVQITASTSGRTLIQAEAFAGGIIGYHSTVDVMEDLPMQCAELVTFNPYTKFDASKSQSDVQVQSTTTEFLRCRNTANVIGVRYVGGIVGYNMPGSKLKIVNSENTGNISYDYATKIQIPQDADIADQISGVSYFIGGITGRNSSTGVIDNCFNEGGVKSPSKYLGGLCEVNEGMISNCIIGRTSKFTVDGVNSVGGIVGLNYSSDKNIRATVLNCKANVYASVFGGSYTGGLVGTNMSTVENCETLASVSASGGDMVGGIVGFNTGTVLKTIIGNAEVRPEIVGNKYVGGLIGDNQGYISEDGEEGGNAGQIQDVLEDLTNYANVTGKDYVGGIVGRHNSSKIFKCFNYGRITAEGARNAVARAGGITGVNDKNTTIEQCENYGSVISHYNYAGGIVGENSGLLEGCVQQDGTVQSDYYQAGGITGSNKSGGVVKNCIARGSAAGAIEGNGNDAIGGIAGKNESGGTMQNNVALQNEAGTNAIIGRSRMGGLVGWNQGTMTSDHAKDNEVSIQLQVNAATSNNNASYATYIGGIVGLDNGTQKELSDYIYSGNIHINAMQRQFIGGIKGLIDNTYTVKNCEFRGNITGTGNSQAIGGTSQGDGGVGGIAGVCSGMVQLTEGGGSGNTIGMNQTLTSGQKIEGGRNVGGVIGNYLSSKTVGEGTLENYADVTGIENVGGVYGTTNQNLSDIKNYGIVTGNKKVGGIVGQMNGKEADHLVNEARGLIQINAAASSNIGGLIGNTGAMTISDSHNFGQLRNTGYTDAANVGGMIGNATNIQMSNCTNGAAGDADKGKIEFYAQNIGGMVGSYNPQVVADHTGKPTVTVGNENMQFENCTNYASIIVGINKANVGGIIGTTGFNNGYLKIFNCSNQGTISVTKADQYQDYQGNAVGGIIGSFTTYGEIVKSSNNGRIVSTNGAWIGGIVGVQKNMSTKYFHTLISGCINDKDGYVEGGGNVGGIVGRQEEQTRLAANLSVIDCENRGTVKGNQSVGGILGQYKDNTERDFPYEKGYNNCTNYGDVILSSHAKVSMDNVGGCIGVSNYPKIVYTNLRNEGKVKVEGTEGRKSSNIGGIIGSAAKKGTVKDCKNNGIMDFRNSKGTLASVGGIAGKIDGESAIMNSVNHKSLLANDSSSDIGGIAGYVVSSTVSGCSTTAVGAAKEMISGKTNVGGIVGRATGASTKIMSIVDSDENSKNYIPCYNTFDVNAKEVAGGIVGELDRVMVISVYNTGAVRVEQQKNPGYSNASHRRRSAGGIAGVSKRIPDNSSELNKGIIINAYNTGKVGWIEGAADAGEVSGFIGGIIGCREYVKNSVNDLPPNDNWKAGATGGAEVRDCYFMEENIQRTRPILKWLDKTEVDFRAWMIGNEPFDSFDTPNNDVQTYENIRSGEKGYWNKRAFEALNELINLDALWKPGDMLGNMTAIMENYFYTLPVPETEEVAGIKGYLYQMKWRGQLGLTSGFEVKLYEAYDAATGEGIGTPVYFRTYKNVNDVLEGLSFDLETLAKDYMGKPLHASVKALGYSVGSGESAIEITKDSPEKVVQSFVMMPPLLPVTKEEFQVIQGETASKVTLVIENVEAFLKDTPFTLFPQLGSLSQGSLLEANLYDRYRNGMKRNKDGKPVISITDYHSDREGVMEDWRRTERELVVDFENNRAELEIDYAQEGSYHGGWYCHTYMIQNDISSSQAASSLKPDQNGEVKYRYIPSVELKVMHKLQSATLLSAPTGIMSTYTGTSAADESGTSFLLEWKNDKQDTETVASYILTFINPVTRKEVKIPIEKHEDVNYSFNLTADIISQCMQDSGYPAYGSNPDLEWTITVVSTGIETNKITYLNRIAECPPVRLPLQEKSVEDLTGTVKEPVFYPYMAEFTWEDESGALIPTYDVTAKAFKVNGMTESNAAISNLQGKTCTVTLEDNDLQEDYQLVFSVNKKGTIGTSLDSADQKLEMIIKKRLPKPTDIKLGEPIYDEEDPSKLILDVQWSKPEVTQQNCWGYYVVVMPAGVLDLGKAQIFKIEGIDNTQAKIKFSTDELSDGCFIYLYSVGVQGVSSSSMPDSKQLILASKALTAPGQIQVYITDGAGQDVDVEQNYSADELSKFTYRLEWENVAEEVSYMRCSKLTLYDSTNAELEIEGLGEVDSLDVLQAKASYSVPMDLSAYAGTELTLKIVNKTNSVNYLSSPAGSVTIKIPGLLEETEEHGFLERNN